MLSKDFECLEDELRRLIALLEEGEDRFWSMMLARGLPLVEGRQLKGATYILGCYGGIDTFSDFAFSGDDLKTRNLNARLTHHRTATFEAAQAITSRRNW